MEGAEGGREEGNSEQRVCYRWRGLIRAREIAALPGADRNRSFSCVGQ